MTSERLDGIEHCLDQFLGRAASLRHQYVAEPLATVHLAGRTVSLRHPIGECKK